MGTKLATVIAHPGHHRLYDRIYRQDDMLRYNMAVLSQKGSHAEKVNHRLTSIEHLALWDMNIFPRGAVLYIMVKYHCWL